MFRNYKVRTDLALEARERFDEKDVKIRGVAVRENYNEEKDIRTTVVRIETENGAKTMGKPQGTYITIEAPNMSVPDEEYHREISQEIAHHILELLPSKKMEAVLVVGLGNHQVTPDALGPKVVDNLHITRHVIREYGRDLLEDDTNIMVSAIVPGVMAQTGIETPDVVIAVDALAARSTRRLNRTIQITNAGINPGSGVGNHREGLNEETLGIRVIGIGIPTVVDAATIVHDAMEHLLDALEEQEQREFLDEMITPNLNQMFVTPKDVDETIKRLSFTISEGLNLAFRQV